MSDGEPGGHGSLKASHYAGSRLAGKEVVVMMDVLVGITGVALILYLAVTIIWPEKF